MRRIDRSLLIAVRNYGKYKYPKGHIGYIKWLIERGANVNIKLPFYDQSLLALAFDGRDRATIELLLDSGADVHFVHSSGYTMLHQVCSSLRCQNPKFVDDCFIPRAKSELKLKKGEASLDEYLPRLIAMGLDVKAKDSYSETPLHRLVGDWKYSEEAIKLLIEHGADIYAKDDYGSSPVDRWAFDDNQLLVKWLEEKQARDEKLRIESALGGVQDGKKKRNNKI